VPPIFSQKHNYNYNETYIHHGHILYKVEIIFPQSLIHYEHTFSTFALDAVCGRVKLFAETSELFTHAVFQLVVVRKTASSECILQGAKKMKDGGSKSGL
jgi:hypothetical protein